MTQMQDTDHQLQTLKAKYQSVLNFLQREKVRLQNLHVQDGKLVLRGVAPSESVKNEVWDQIKLVDPSFRDLMAEITVSADAAAAPSAPAVRSYTVVKGDSLWKIAEKFFGAGAQLVRLIEANPDKLRDRDSVIHPGDVLMIPG